MAPTPRRAREVRESLIRFVRATVTAMLDLDFVRPRFPALETDWCLFDNAGGSVALGAVADSVAAYMRECMVQLGASYALSVDASERVAAGHRAAERLFGAGRDEVAIGPSSTLLVRFAAQALRPLWRERDEVVVTDLDHESNIGAWRSLEASGIVVREWRCVDDSLALRVEDLEPLLNERTRLVAFTHCSNIVGDVQDAAAICERIREAGALSCVDGVAFAPHRRVDVAALGCDLYFASLYKVFGPHISALFARRELFGRMDSVNHFFVGRDDVPYKLEPGNVNHELTAALPAVVDYLEALDRHHGGEGSIDGAFARIESHEARLAAPVFEFLREHRRVTLIGPNEPSRHAPTISFVVDGEASSAIPPRLDELQVAVRFGHFYAHRLIDRLGLLERDGVVRISMAHYNSMDEVERLVASLDRVL